MFISTTTLPQYDWVCVDQLINHVLQKGGKGLVSDAGSRSGKAARNSDSHTLLLALHVNQLCAAIPVISTLTMDTLMVVVAGCAIKIAAPFPLGAPFVVRRLLNTHATQVWAESVLQKWGTSRVDKTQRNVCTLLSERGTHIRSGLLVH